MELKFGIEQSGNSYVIRSNRTFMELKWEMLDEAARRKGVLIAPLWN